MSLQRRTHKPGFKAKVALAAVQGDLTTAELVKKFDVHANQVTAWKKQLYAAHLRYLEAGPIAKKGLRKKFRRFERRLVN
tara:strand:- start:223 stop:462 length:240 start_codon:yes stop_codon:yes gene_type:complete